MTPRLIQLLREALDQSGYRHVRIVASGGFDAAKIGRFEQLGVPVDVYGVGSALVHGATFDHTADIVRVGGRDVAKVGRGFVDSDPSGWDQSDHAIQPGGRSLLAVPLLARDHALGVLAAVSTERTFSGEDRSGSPQKDFQI